MEKKRVSIIGFITNIFLIIFICLFGYIFITIYNGGVPEFFGYSFLRVISTSMEPIINHDDMILVKKVNADDIKTGDVITFKSRDPYLNGFLNTHRVVDIIEDGESGEREFVTKGDANGAEDYYTAWESKIIGRYVKKVAGGRNIVKIINLLKHRILYFIIMVLPVLICFVHSIYSVITFIYGKKDKSGNDRKDKDDGREKRE